MVRQPLLAATPKKKKRRKVRRNRYEKILHKVSRLKEVRESSPGYQHELLRRRVLKALREATENAKHGTMQFDLGSAGQRKNRHVDDSEGDYHYKGQAVLSYEKFILMMGAEIESQRDSGKQMSSEIPSEVHDPEAVKKGLRSDTKEDWETVGRYDGMSDTEILADKLKNFKDPTLIPPFFYPVKIENPCDGSNRSITVMALIDTGADHTILAKEFATTCLLDMKDTRKEGKLIGFSAAAPAVDRIRSTYPLLFYGGGKRTLVRPDINVFPKSLNVNMLLGRDLFHAFGLNIGPLPLGYPDEKASQDPMYAEPTMGDCMERKSLVSDFPLEALKEVERTKLRARLQKKLDEHVQIVPENGFINHPQATVRLIHDTPNRTSFVPQYAFKKPAVKQLITEWIDKMVVEGRFEVFNQEKHGQEFLLNNTPLMTTPSKRVCADLRDFNRGLLIDPSKIANIPGIYHEMGTAGYTVFTELDLKGAFLQFMIAKEDQHKLVFTWGGKQYISKSAVFGLAHMAQICSRVLTLIFADHKNVRIYCDNIIIGSKNFEDHERHVIRAIDIANEHNIRLNPAKCKLAYAQLMTLGNIISEKGVTPDPEKVERIMNWVTPDNPKALGSFLSTANYLRCFVRNFSALTACLHKLRNLRAKEFKEAWNKKHELAFQMVKKALANAPMLLHADWSKEFTMVCDASITGLGGVLYQPTKPRDPPSPENIVMFYSRGLQGYEKAFSVYRLELTAIVFGLRQCDEFISDRHFTLLTDHNALIYLHSQKNFNRILLGHFAVLSDYTFSIFHLPGHLNRPSDGLSRAYQKVWDSYIPSTSNGEGETSEELAQERQILLALVENSAAEMEDLQQHPHYMEISEEFKKPKTPDEAQELVRNHHTRGHFGTEATMQSLKKEGWCWMGMTTLVDKVCHSCSACQKWAKGRKTYHPIRAVKAFLPWDRIQIDFVTSFNETETHNRYVMVVYDVMTGFCLIRATKSRTSLDCATVLWLIFCDFGIPKCVQTDGDGTFIGQIFQDMVREHGAQHVIITAYTPRINGGVERAIATISDMLHKFQSALDVSWDKLIPFCQVMLNNKHRKLTGMTPFAMFMNRDLNLFESYTNMEEWEITATDIQQWKDKEAYLHEIIFPTILFNKDKLKEVMSADFARGRTIQKEHLEIGVMVMLSDVVRPDKNSQPWLGPFMIVGISQSGHYWLKDSAGGMWHRQVPREHLKVLKHADLKMMSNGDYVARVTAHRDVDGVRQYKVMWADASEDSWVPAQDFDDLQCIKDYFARRTTIPKPSERRIRTAQLQEEEQFTVKEIHQRRGSKKKGYEYLVSWEDWDEQTWITEAQFGEGEMIREFDGRRIPEALTEEPIMVMNPNILDMGEEVPIIEAPRSSRSRVSPKRFGSL